MRASENGRAGTRKAPADEHPTGRFDEHHDRYNQPEVRTGNGPVFRS